MTPRLPSRRSALLALMLIVPAPTVGVLAAMVVMPGETLGQIIFFVCKAWMLTLPMVWLLFVDRQRLSLSPARNGGFGVGALLGVVISALIGGVYLLFGEALIDADHVKAMADQNGIGTPARYIGACVFWVLVNSVLEEYVYRWFIFRKCEVLLGGKLAVLASALFFTIHHIIALKVQFDWTVTALATFGVFVGGAVWSWLYLRYCSVWPGYLSHAIVDIAIFLIGWRLIFGS